MYFMTSPATAMTMALSMMDEAARESRQQRRGRPVRASRRARRRPAVAMERPARRTGGLARVFGSLSEETATQ